MLKGRNAGCRGRRRLAIANFETLITYCAGDGGVSIWTHLLSDSIYDTKASSFAAAILHDAWLAGASYQLHLQGKWMPEGS